ncbi:MAG: hypothetical protein JNM75_04045 [Rhodospirillales bacterium]|nr:hypothetical protein [Rhodospirillales bacterium]
MATLDDYTDAKLGKLVKEAAGISEQKVVKQTSSNGAVIGGAAGAAVGMAVAGPIGAVIGGALGALFSPRNTPG